MEWLGRSLSLERSECTTQRVANRFDEAVIITLTAVVYWCCTRFP
jgi:hypothetical protein